MRRVLLLVGGFCVLAGLVWALRDVSTLAASELAFRSERHALAEAEERWLTLGHVTLSRGQSVTFNVCASDAFDPKTWGRATFLLRHHNPDETVLRAPVDEARLQTRRRGPAGACFDLARTDSLAGEGDFSVVLQVGEGTTLAQLDRSGDAVVWTYITALRPLTGAHTHGPLLAWCGVLLLIASFLVRPAAKSAYELLSQDTLSTPPPSAPAARFSPLAVLGVALAGLAATMALVTFVPLAGYSSMLPGLLLWLSQLALALVLVRDADALGLRVPRRWPWLLLLMPLAGALLRSPAGWISALVPATGVAPVERLVSAPSGMLGMLAIGLVAPFAEEIYFRGLLFAALERARGVVFAGVFTALLFALLHLPQAFGAWPSFVSICLAGFFFTLVRALTGSTLASLLAHLGYNGVIALPVILRLLS